MLNIGFPLCLSCVSPAAALISCVFATAHVPGTLASLLRDLQAGCEVMELENTSSIAWLCREICLCQHMFSGSGLSPWAISCLLPCRQDTAVGYGPCCGVLGIHAVGPRCHCSTTQTRQLHSMGKGPHQDWQILAKSGIPLLFQSDCCPQGLVWFQSSYFQELMGFTIDSVSQTCWCFAETSVEAAAEICWFSTGFSILLVWDGTFGLFLCCWVSKTSGKLCHHCKGRAAGQCF